MKGTSIFSKFYVKNINFEIISLNFFIPCASIKEEINKVQLNWISRDLFFITSLKNNQVILPLKHFSNSNCLCINFKKRSRLPYIKIQASSVSLCTHKTHLCLPGAFDFFIKLGVFFFFLQKQDRKVNFH